METTTASAPRRRTRRRKLPWILAAIGLLIVAYVAVVALAALRADHHLRQGLAAAQSARQGLDVDTIASGGAQIQLAAAAADFATAHNEVSAGWITPLRWVPILGTQVRSVSDLSASAHTVASSGSTALGQVHALLNQPRSTPSERTVIVGQLAGDLRVLSDRMAHLDFGPAHGLIGSLASKRTTFVTDVGNVQTGLTKATGATAALAQVLRGPTTYLIAATNNAEMRAGSGMMLQAGTIDINDGRFQLSHFEPTGSLVDTKTTLRPTGDLAARWGFEDPTSDFRELLLSPQFPANASLASEMWRERTGQRVGGVVTIDVAALQDLLGATGPITVDGTTYSTSNVVTELLVTQYAGITNVSDANQARHQKQAALAAAVFAAIDRGSMSLTNLAKAFDQAVDGRDLMVWSGAPAVEADWQAAGAGGTVSGNDVLLSLLNQGANKLDPYQKVTADASVDPSDGRTTVTARVTVDNQTPSTLSGYAAGGAAGTPPARQYTGAVAVDFPADATLASVSGGAIESVGPDGSSQVVAVKVAIPDGKSHTVTVRFVLTGASGRLDVQPSARLPATTWNWSIPGAPTSFSDSTAHTVSW
jgi:Protein of unknown function (DUF4012)